MIACVNKPKRAISKRSRSVPTYFGRYRLRWMPRIVQVELGVTDKQVAEQRLRKLIEDVEREHAGIVAPKAVLEGACRPVLEHLSQYCRYITARGRSAKYVRNVKMWVARPVRECGWETLRDITPASFMLWRSAQSAAPKTLNQYLGAANSCINWLKDAGRTMHNPLATVKPVETAGRERRVRRALTDDEVLRLLVASPRHRPVYLVALMTGLRRNELKELRWSDVDLDSARPVLRVRASTTKNKKAAVIPLRDDLVVELRAIRPASMGPDRRVFHRRIPRMPEFRADLKRAKIAGTDEQGRRVDFHALRHTLGTNLSRYGVAPRSAMEIMRHSDMRLTQRAYTDVSRLPLDEAMEKLPRWNLPAEKPSCETAEFCSKIPDISGHLVAFSGTIAGRKDASLRGAQPHGNPLESSVFEDSPTQKENSAGRIRTYNQSVNSRLLYH